MQKIKISFTKCFPAVLLAAAVLVVLSKAGKFAGNLVVAHIPALDYIHGIVFNVIGLLVMSPFYIGLYGFLFKRIEGEKPRVTVVFDFYRGAGKFFKSSVVRCIDMLIIVFLSAFFMPLMSFSSDGERMVASVFVLVIILGIYLIFELAPAVYAKNPDGTIGEIITTSVRLGIKYMYILIIANAIKLALSVGYFLIMPRVSLSGSFTDYLALMGYSDNIFKIILDWLLNALTTWLSFTAAYIILEKARNTAENADTAENTVNNEDTPFIEPYDFYIEADERFNDEKTVRTEDIRGTDILEIFDGMELAEDVRVDAVIRKKLKRMFDDLAFEIGEYITYEGGREIENDFAEEVDDREFEVSVKISKGSDYEPFTLTVRVNSEE